MARKQARATSGKGETARQRGRRILRVFAALAVAGIVGWAVFTLYRPSTFPVRHVQLTGELGHLDQAQLREVVLPYVTKGFLRIDVTGIRAGVESLPWVNKASVRRVWPDVVEVEIREKKALARWGDTSLVSEEGRLFSPPVAQWPEGLPMFQGPEETPGSMAAHYRGLREVLTPVGLRISSLQMNDRRALTMELDNGVRVLLGRSDQQTRLERFVRAYSLVVEGNVTNVGQVDLRYTNGFSVIWKTRDPQA